MPVWPGARVSGPAFPVACSAGDNLAIHVAVAEAPPGSVLVVSVGVEPERGYWGEVLTTGGRGARHRRARDRRRRPRRRRARSARFPVFSTMIALRGATKNDAGRDRRRRARSATSTSSSATGSSATPTASPSCPERGLDEVLAAGGPGPTRKSIYFEQLRAGAHHGRAARPRRRSDRPLLTNRYDPAMQDIELVPLCTIEATLSPQPIVVGKGAAGMRIIFEVGDGEIEGERLRGTCQGHRRCRLGVAARRTGHDRRAHDDRDTHDGAIVYVQYHGKVRPHDANPIRHPDRAPLRNRRRALRVAQRGASRRRRDIRRPTAALRVVRGALGQSTLRNMLRSVCAISPPIAWLYCVVSSYDHVSPLDGDRARVLRRARLLGEVLVRQDAVDLARRQFASRRTIVSRRARTCRPRGCVEPRGHHEAAHHLARGAVPQPVADLGVERVLFVARATRPCGSRGRRGVACRCRPGRTASSTPSRGTSSRRVRLRRCATRCRVPRRLPIRRSSPASGPHSLFVSHGADQDARERRPSAAPRRAPSCGTRLRPRRA